MIRKWKFMFTEFIKLSTKTEDVLMLREEKRVDLKLIYKFVWWAGGFLNKLLLLPHLRNRAKSGVEPGIPCSP